MSKRFGLPSIVKRKLKRSLCRASFRGIEQPPSYQVDLEGDPTLRGPSCERIGLASSAVMAYTCASLAPSSEVGGGSFDLLPPLDQDGPAVQQRKPMDITEADRFSLWCQRVWWPKLRPSNWTMWGSFLPDRCILSGVPDKQSIDDETRILSMLQNPALLPSYVPAGVEVNGVVQKEAHLHLGPGLRVGLTDLRVVAHLYELYLCGPVGSRTPVVNEVCQTSNPYSCLSEDSGDCDQIAKYGVLARESVRLFRKEFPQIHQQKPLPTTIRCGELRSAVRGCYGSLDEICELSLRTVSKLEQRICSQCEDKYDDFVSRWMEDRTSPVVTSPGHLQVFRRCLASNVKSGWNKRKFPYIPNGHATLFRTRREGGTWNEESFRDWCKPCLVVSSGKPRVVTLYSEYNTRVLTPLHLSLYESLCEKGWVLRGPPTDSVITSLNGDGDFISLDYVSATDSFKSSYVNAAIDVLIEKAEGISEEEIRCLRVLGELRFEPGGQCASSGQPMGSVMSFPLLCLFNKTLQDLALEDLLLTGSISFKEWTSHRTRINGDDSLTREPRSGEAILLPRIEHHGSMVGMRVNREKSMVSPAKGEINSTLFENQTLQKKTNFSSLSMKPEVSDVLGFARDSTRTVRGFRSVVLKNRRILSKQSNKFLFTLPKYLRDVVWADSRLACSVTSSPRDKRKEKSGYLTMCPRPAGYFLDREVEVSTINSAVASIRAERSDFSVQRSPKFRTLALPGTHKPATRKPSPGDTLILSCLAGKFYDQEKEKLRNEEFQLGAVSGPVPLGLLTGENDSSALFSQSTSKINSLVGMIRSLKTKEIARNPQPEPSGSSELPSGLGPFGESNFYTL